MFENTTCQNPDTLFRQEFVWFLLNRIGIETLAPVGLSSHISVFSILELIGLSENWWKVQLVRERGITQLIQAQC